MGSDRAGGAGMIDNYIRLYADDPQSKYLIAGNSGWKRWIPETQTECDSLECMDCAESLVGACMSNRCHGNCEFQNSLPETTMKQSSITIFEGATA